MKSSSSSVKEEAPKPGKKKVLPSTGEKMTPVARKRLRELRFL